MGQRENKLHFPFEDIKFYNAFLFHINISLETV